LSGIWSSGEHSMTLYMGGRQIFEMSQEVHIREEGNKSNIEMMAKLLMAGSHSFWIFLIACAIPRNKEDYFEILRIEITSS
jgi:hypothetical protein